MKKYIVIPDTQVRPEDDLAYLSAIGNYLVAKKPDVIVQIGDFADMSSLSSYDIGKKSFEGRRYVKDIAAAHTGMLTLLNPIWDYNSKARKNGKKQYKPEMHLTLGNHENRIERVIEGDPKLDGTMSTNDLKYQEFGWTVHPFLKVCVLDNIAFSHYFVTGTAGRPSSTANAQLNKQHMSCIAGHQQGLQIATSFRGDGSSITSVICGSCYEHEEGYLGPQGNKHFRGILVLHEVEDGNFNLMPVTLSYLMRKYL